MRETFEQTNLQDCIDRLNSPFSADRLTGATGLAALALKSWTKGAARTRRAPPRTTQRERDEEIIASAKEALTDNHVEVRRSVAFILGELHNEASIGILSALAANDAESAVRAESLDAMGKIGGSLSVKAIQTVIETDLSVEVRMRGVRALSVLGVNHSEVTDMVAEAFERLAPREPSDLVKEQIQRAQQRLASSQ